MAVFLVSVMLLSMMQPVSGNVTVARDDFGVLDAFAATLGPVLLKGSRWWPFKGHSLRLRWLTPASARFSPGRIGRR